MDQFNQCQNMNAQKDGFDESLICRILIAQRLFFASGQIGAFIRRLDILTYHSQSDIRQQRDLLVPQTDGYE